MLARSPPRELARSRRELAAKGRGEVDGECRKNGAAEVELAGAVELVGTMPTGAPEGGQIIPSTL